MRKIPYRLTLVAAMSLVSFGGASVYAIGANGSAHAETATTTTDATGKPADAGSHGATHLAAAQLKACQKRETAINHIMARVVDRGTKQIVVFDKIATRTETFYTTKGKTVANYDTLVAAVDAAKSKAQTDLAAMKTTATLDCASTDPKGGVSAFKTSVKSEIASLKAYKTAVKNLIVAVKSVQGTDSSAAKASPTISPATNQGGAQ